MMRKILIVLLALLPLRGWSAVDTEPATFFYYYPLDATAFTYCRVLGERGSPFQIPIQGNAPIKTTGSSTSVTEVTADTNPFTNIAVPDVLAVRRLDNSVDLRTVLVRTDDSNVTVHAAVDWSDGFQWRWYDQECGTAATSGWVSVSGWTARKVVIDIPQMAVTGGIDIRIEGKDEGLGAAAVVVYPNESSNGCGSGGTHDTTDGACTFTAALTAITRLAVDIPEKWSNIRVGVKIDSADDGGDLTTNEEQILIYMTGQRTQ